jgi:hypothetical protein
VISGVVEAVCTSWTERSSPSSPATTTTTATASATSSSSSISEGSGPFGYTKRVTKAGYLVKEGASGLTSPPFLFLLTPRPGSPAGVAA